MRYAFFAFLISLFFIWGCSSYTYKTDFDPAADFGSYKTYMWYAGKMPDDDALSKNPLVKKRVGAGIDKALQAKGYQIGTQEAFDFIVLTHAGDKQKTQITSTGGYGYGGYGYGGYGRGWGGYGGYGTTDVYQYDETTLVIDIIDGKSKEMVWRGTVTGVVGTPKNQEEQQKRIDAVVEKMLDDFPPEK